MACDLWSRFSSVVGRRPDRPALIQSERTVSFQVLSAAAARAARTLAAAGVRSGDRCVIWGENAPELAASLLGLLALGAIPSMVNAEAPPAHYRHALGVVGARVALADEPRLPLAAFDGTLLALERVGDLTGEDSPAVPPAERHAMEPASIFFTSGSTGLPKGVTQSHANLIWGCEAVAASIGLKDEDRILCAIPWAFDYGWGQLLSTLLLGLPQILPDAKSATAICSAIERHRPSVLPSVPSLMANLIRGVSPLRETDRSSIRLITNTGSRIPDSLLPEIVELFPEAALSLNYGLTETYRSASLPTQLARAHPTAVGRAIPGVRLAVVREDGTEADAGEEGEIVHRGAGVFLGYWGEADKTARARRPDPLWRHEGLAAPMAMFTGDLGRFDQDGLLYVHGRRDRQIKSMGVRVSPEEIEGLIQAAGLVAEAAIVSRPHDILGEMVVAVVSPLRPSEDPVKALQKACRSSMSPYMRPMEWNLVPALPRTPNGKVDHAALRRSFGGEPPS